MSQLFTTVTRTNVLAGAGTMYVGDFEAAEPADTAVGTVPATGAWTGVGGTDGGITVTVEQSWFVKRADQDPDSLGEVLTERTVTVQTNMLEVTLENLAHALNNSVPTTGSGFKKLSLDHGHSAMFPTEKAVIVDGLAPGTDKNRRFIARRVLSVESVGNAFTKDGMQMFPVTWRLAKVDNSTPPCDWIDETA